MSEVFLIRGSYQQFFQHPQKILEGFKQAGFALELKKGEFAGIKIHFGEKGNKSYIHPLTLLPLARFLKSRQAKPFLFDTNTLYRGERMNAIDHINLAKLHGFGKLNIPIIIADGIRGNDYEEIRIDKKHFSTCFLAYALRDVDFLLTLSHFTGHMLFSFGGALKSLGMGCAARKGKLSQHCQVSPKINQKQCIICGICAENCPAGAIVKRNKYYIEEEKCIGCAQCISVCPQGAVKIIWFEEGDILGEKLMEYAYAASRGRRCAYINFCVYITKNCDCMNKETKGFVQDLGILYSWDPVSIDKASVDLLISQEGRDFLKEIYPKVDYLRYLNYAQEIGLGSLEYKLIEVGK